MELVFDPRSEFGQRVLRRLEQECIIWLTTVRRDGLPQPTPVWFLWTGEDFIFFTRAHAQKLKNLRKNPHISLHLDGDGEGGDIVIFWGAALLDQPVSQAEMERYIAKYREGITRLRMTEAEFTGAYTVPIRVRPIRLLGH